jgi:hypothetical protein
MGFSTKSHIRGWKGAKAWRKVFAKKVFENRSESAAQRRASSRGSTTSSPTGILLPREIVGIEEAIIPSLPIHIVEVIEKGVVQRSMDGEAPEVMRIGEPNLRAGETTIHCGIEGEDG